MSGADDAATIVSALPAPPHYYKLFGKEGKGAAGAHAERAGVEGGEGEGEDHARGDGANATGFPLTPPPLPAVGDAYSVFGVTFTHAEGKIVTENLLPPEKLLYKGGEGGKADEGSRGGASAEAGEAGEEEEGQVGSQQAAPSEGSSMGHGSGTEVSYAVILRRLLDAIMQNFTQLLDVLVRYPALHRRKMADMEQLFLNFHNALNEYRSHQAREVLIRKLEQQGEGLRQQLTALTEAVEQAKAQLSSSESDLDASLEALGVARKGEEGEGGEGRKGTGTDQGNETLLQAMSC